VDNNQPIYPYINIILPPDGEPTPAAVLTWVESAFTRIRGGASLNADEHVILGKMMRVVTSTNLRAQSVVSEIRIGDEPILNVVVAASRYRNEGTDFDFDLTGPWKTDHDLWAPHLAWLVNALVDKVRSTASVVFVEVGDGLPLNVEARKLFDDMDDVGYASLESSAENSDLAATFELANRCLNLAVSGEVRQALIEIDSARALTIEQKFSVKVQVLNRSGHAALATTEIRTALDAGTEIDSRTLLGFSAIAQKAGEQGLAKEILSKVPTQTLGEEALGLVLSVARELGIESLANEAAELLNQRWPAALGLRDETLDALKDLCAPPGPDNTRSIYGFPAQVRALARWLHNAFDVPLPDLRTMLDAGKAVAGSNAAAMQFCLAYGASQRGLTRETLVLANPSNLAGHAARFAVGLLVAAMERYFLDSPDDRAPVELLSDAALEVIRYLSKRPADQWTTATFARVLAPETSGHTGIALLVHTALRLAKEGAEVVNLPGLDTEPASGDQLMQFVAASTKSLAAVGNMLDRWVIPDELLVPSADALLAGFLQLIDESQNHDNSEADRTTLDMLASFGVAVARRSSLPNTDLTILRIWGGRVSSTHSPQRGRDLAQMLLESAGVAPVRCRLAWFGYGDIYLRGRNTLEGLLGLCCAMATGAALPARESADEVGALMRALRDAGMVELSDDMMPVWKRVMERAGASDRDFNRAETTRLSTAMRRILADRSNIATQLPALVHETSKNLAMAIELADNPLPAALALGQLRNIARTFKVDVAEKEFCTLLQARGLLEGVSAEIYDLVVEEATPAKLAQYTRTLDKARFSSDVGYDVKVVTLAAHRLLADRYVQRDTGSVLYASELLTELCLTPASDMNAPSALPTWWPESIEIPAEFAASLSQMGIDVGVLATNSDDRVVASFVHNGMFDAPREIADAQFSMPYFRTWSRQFPFEYGLDRDQYDNTFFDTMERLQPGFDLCRATVFICEAQLQQLPSNLFINNGGFAGYQQPVAMAPSLTWLSGAVAAPPGSFGPPVAWVSDAANPGADNTLNFLANLLHDTCDRHGIALERSTTPPTTLAEAELAIVGAHGGLSDGNHFFRVVADEGNTRMTARTLAEALDRCNVAVLFVCSGGRMDKHPLSNSVLGLPKDLLNGGRQAVVASPWPLDARVPGHWLGTFLDAWNIGDTLMVANFKANQEVARRMGENPAHCLAMTVYGNPLVTRTSCLGSSLKN
jgi:hypothetical protein